MSAKKELKFERNWNNKLRSEYFTTIRLKDDLADNEKGIQIMLKQEEKYLLIGEAEVVEKNVMTAKGLDAHIIGLNFGLSLEEGMKVLRQKYPRFENEWLNYTLLRFTERFL